MILYSAFILICICSLQEVEHSTGKYQDRMMEKVKLDYSTKNIPLPKEDHYKKRLIEKTERLIKNMRWKTFFYMNPKVTSEQKETYGFNTRKTPPPSDELKAFEEQLTSIIQKVEFEHHPPCGKFQKELNSDIREIRKNNNLYVKADKTSNHYQVKSSEYRKLLMKNVHKTYKSAQKDVVHKITEKAKEIAEEIELSDRIETTAEKEPFITLKDHKENFENNPTCRLINPSKSELGRVSKQITEQMVKQTAESARVNLWRKTTDVVNWFEDIQNKESTVFINFDIVDFYPSISEELLKKAIQFAETFQPVTDLQKKIIMQTKKSLLFTDNKPWSKKDTNNLFDVTMGSFDGAETCELVVVYLLSQLKMVIPNVGLYRDDGLAFSNEKPCEVEKTKKQICKIFSDNGLKVKIEANHKVIDFLDVTLNLKNEKFYPYMKDGNRPVYVNAESNHPPAVLKAIPKGVNERLCSISSDAEVFEQAAPPYQEALKKSGYNHKLEFSKKERQTKKNKKNRTRNIIWFNPPYSSNVKTNIGNRFLELVDVCFPKGSKLNKLFNRNTVKVSYSCMPNVKAIIDSHNKKITLHSSMPEVEQGCNYRVKDDCPLKGSCRQKSIIYKATIKEESGKEHTWG